MLDGVGSTGQEGETSRHAWVNGALQVKTSRTPNQKAGDGGLAATPLRANPRALRYDSMPSFKPPLRAAASSRFRRQATRPLRLYVAAAGDGQCH